jgi:DNA (cytosine-5)-methyltransferase 1
MARASDQNRAALRVRPRLLDLFCGAGGAAMGYHRAGFEVVGVDIRPQPNYPFEFVQDDALLRLEGPWPEQFDAIHASPPCQAFTVYGNTGNVGDYPDLIAPTRELLRATGLPWVIENVPGAPLENPTVICGTSLGLEVRRHRLFETNWSLMVPPCAHGQFAARKYPGSTNRPNGRTVCNVGEWRVPLAQQKRAMGIGWMTLEELSEAVPPAYTELIGHQLLQHLRVVV